MDARHDERGGKTRTRNVVTFNKAMEKDIVNKVANSALQTIDLEELYPAGKRMVLDIKPWLFQEIILKETDFRAFVAAHDWQQYNNAFVALTCSSEAVIPSWAYLLVSTQLFPLAKKVVVGDFVLLETVLFQEVISTLDIRSFSNKPVIIKGCADKPIPPTAFLLLIQKIQPVAKSILYGEACSTVPLYKQPKKTE